MENSESENMSSEVTTAPCGPYQTDLKSDSENNNNETGSMSEETGHVVGVTMAALELVNGNPVSNVSSDKHVQSVYETVDPDQSYGPDNAHSVISSFLDENRLYHEYSATKSDSASYTPLLNAQPLTELEYCPVGLSHSLEFVTVAHKEINTNIPITQYDYTDHVGDGHGVNLGDSPPAIYYDHENSLGHTSVIVKTPGRSFSDSDNSQSPNSLNNASVTPDVISKKRAKVFTEHDSDEEGINGVERNSISKPPPHLLPPCKVCGVQATGFHYGVNTCEACKGFFRRSIIRKQPYTCANNPLKCVISPGKRKTCPSCRYKKCLESGMSVEGIKIGRYTYAKRTQDILELNTGITTSTTSPPLHTNTPGIHRPQDSNSYSPPQPVSQDVVEFINIILEANELKYPTSLKDISMVEQIQERVKEQHAKGEIPASMNEVSMDQFLSVLNSTGVQLDNRIQIIQQWVVLLEEGLKYVVSFAKEIPGFRDLKLPDQMGLIKHSICEVWIISRHMAFHTDFDYFTTKNGMTLDVVRTLGEKFGKNIVKVTRSLRELELTPQEIIILKAYVIFFTDRCEIDEWQKVTHIRERLQDALLHLFSQRGANTARQIGKLSSILTELRMTTELYQEYTKKIQILSTTTGAMNLPPLLQEVMNVT